jgi:hypothetical protein
LRTYLVGRVDEQLRPLATVSARIRLDQTPLFEGGA